MKKVCSFLPAATQLLYDLALQDRLLGVTFECPYPGDKPVVVHCKLAGQTHDSQEIDRIYSEAKASGESLYRVDEPLLQELAPEVVITQDVCEVCQIDTRVTQQALAKLNPTPELINYSPDTLEDVFSSAGQVGEILGASSQVAAHLQSLRQRIELVVDRLREKKAPLRRVMLMEWFAPIYNCGHWIPDQLALAGGVDMLSHPGGDSVRIEWEKVRKYNPEVLILAPCGYTVSQSLEEIGLMEEWEGWQDLRAVQEQQVYILDFDLFTQPSPSTLVHGIELLAGLFHPDCISIPRGLEHKWQAFPATQVV